MKGIPGSSTRKWAVHELPLLQETVQSLSVQLLEAAKPSLSRTGSSSIILALGESALKARLLRLPSASVAVILTAITVLVSPALGLFGKMNSVITGAAFGGVG